jgi:hypothetical protein
MKIFCNEWTRLDVSCPEFDAVAHDSIIPVEFVLQAGEAKFSMQSDKFVLGDQLFFLERNNVLKSKMDVQYVIHLKNIDAMSLMTENGHCELYVTSVSRSESEFKITGLNGFMSFQGPNLEVAFLRADDYGWVLEPVEGVGKCFAEMQRETGVREQKSS